MTTGEKKLWSVLRRLDLGIRRQAPIGRYIVDFAQHSARLVVEIDGGCHRLPEVQLRDAERETWLRSQGYRILRFDNEIAYSDPWSIAEAVAAMIGSPKGMAWAPDRVSAFDGLPTPPTPTLPPSRGKGAQ